MPFVPRPVAVVLSSHAGLVDFWGDFRHHHAILHVLQQTCAQPRLRDVLTQRVTRSASGHSCGLQEA